MRLRAIFRAGSLPMGRVEAFSDGVFAIVVTLLVLELHVPQVLGDELSAALVHLAPKFLAYVMSFVVVIVWWVAHHQFFAVVRRTDRGLLWLNSLFLLWLTFIPFPTALLGEYHEERVPVAFYGAAMALVGVSFFLMRWYAARWGRLMEEKIDPQLVKRSLRRGALSPLLYAAGALVTLANAEVALAVYALIPVLYFLPGHLERHAPAVNTDATGA